ncbi:transposase [Turicimonas muris]|nr:transposase [Turicimonas muris]
MYLETGRIIHVCEGRTVEKVCHFFEHLINKGLEGQIQMVCVDMHAGYHSLVKEYLPQAVVIYDLFHVMQHFGQDVLKAAVSSCARSFSQNHQQKLVRGYRRQLRKSSWFILASDSSLLKHADSKTYYEEIIRDNELLFMLQPIADLLRGIWQAENEIEASNRLDGVAGLLDEAQKKFKFPAADKFKRMLTKRAKEIVMACLFKGFGTKRLERATATIKKRI